MGKGNRSRIERAMNETANAEKHVQAKKSKVSGAGIFVCVAALLVVVALLVGAIGVVNDSGWFARSQTVIKTDNFEVDGSMMNYFYTTQINNYYQYYYQMLQSYASSGIDVSKMVYQYMGITDANKSFKDQNMPAADGAETVTVFDYYMSLTEDYVTRMLTYCEFAVKAGLELTDEDYADIDKTLEEMEASYKANKKAYDENPQLYQMMGMIVPATYSAYLAQNYGEGVKVKDIRNCMALVALAAKFETKLTDEKKQGIIDDESNKAVEEFVKENPSLFLMADYYAYSFSVSSKGKTDAEFEADKAEILEKAKALAACTDKEAYKAAVVDLLIETAKESFREENWEKYLKENDNDEEKANAALEEYFQKTYYIDSYKDLKFNATLTEGYKYPSTHTDLSKWIFGYDAGEHTDDCKHEGEHEKSNDPAKKGDLTYIETTTEKEETVSSTTTSSTTAATTEAATTDAASPASEETTEAATTEATTEAATTGSNSSSTSNKVKVTTYTVTVYLLEKETYRNEEITKHFGYVMFASKADAEKFYEEYKKGEMNKDTLLETIEKMSGQVTPFAYDAVEDYLVGDLEGQDVTGADKWLREAKPGDHSDVIELVYTTKSTSSSSSSSTTLKPTTYYSILVYDQDGYQAWYCDALSGATDNAVADWYEENALELTFNEKAYKFINS